MKRLSLALFALLVPSSARAQAIVAIPPPPANGDCFDTIWPDGRGYVPIAYMNEGIVAYVDHLGRTDNFISDEDWDLYLRPAKCDPYAATNHLTQPLEQWMFGRDCVTEQNKFVDLMWGSTPVEWWMITLGALKFVYDIYGIPGIQHSDVYPLMQGYPVPNPIEDNDADDYWENDDFAHAATMLARNPSAYWALGKKLWKAAFLNDASYANLINLYGFQVVQGEVQVSRLTQPDERSGTLGGGPLPPDEARVRDFLPAADLVRAEDDGCPPGGTNRMCRNVLLYGTYTIDNNHSGGKPEVHPVRGIVTLDSAADRTRMYKVRAFGDYGKASGDAGGGSFAGYICESWPRTGLNYLTILPEVFQPPPAGSSTVFTCSLMESMRRGLHSVTNSQTTYGTCPAFAMNPGYTDGVEHFNLPGWYVGKMLTTESSLIIEVETKPPVDLGAGMPQGGPHTPARNYKVTATAKAYMTSASGRHEVSPQVKWSWSLPHDVFTIGGPPTSNTVDLYVPIAPKKVKEFNQYTFSVSANGSYLAASSNSGAKAVHLPKPAIKVDAVAYNTDVTKPQGATKGKIVYRPTFKASTSGFLADATHKPQLVWVQKRAVQRPSLQRAGATPGQTVGVAISPRPGSLQLAEGDLLGMGEQVELKLGEGKPRPISVSGADSWPHGPFESAVGKVDAKIPVTTVDVVPSDVTRSGKSGSGMVTYFGFDSSCVTSSSTPYISHAQVQATARMALTKSPYTVPPVSAPQFKWSTLQVRRLSAQFVGPTAWAPVSNANVARSSSAGGSHDDVLTVKVDDPLQAYEFRVLLTGADDYGRHDGQWIFFTNFEEDGEAQSQARCFQLAQPGIGNPGGPVEQMYQQLLRTNFIRPPDPARAPLFKTHAVAPFTPRVRTPPASIPWTPGTVLGQRRAPSGWHQHMKIERSLSAIQSQLPSAPISR